ncbi:MAG: type IV secretion system DNA-binding domain-containing protein [Vampirovibrio sp.]
MKLNLDELLLYWWTPYVWRDQEVDALVFSRPVHLGQPEQLARNLYHRMVVRIACSRLYWRQWWVLIYCAIGCALGHAVPQLWPEWVPVHVGLEVIGFLIGTVVGGVWLVPYVMKDSVKAYERKEARAIVRRTMLRDVPDGTPADLADAYRYGWLTSQGNPLSLEVSEADFRNREGGHRAGQFLWCCVAVGCVFGSLLGYGLGSSVLLGAIILGKMTLDHEPVGQRMQELEAQEGVEALIALSSGSHQRGETVEAARQKQMQEAIKDETPLFKLGVSTGILAARNDDFAPSAGLEMALSLRDLQQHLLVLGGTGSGKTSGIIRPLALQIAQQEAIGLIVMDGKGSLPHELADLPDMVVVEPTKHCLSLVSGLDPAAIASTISAILSQKGGDRFWTDSARILLYNAAWLCKTLTSEGYWSLDVIGKTACQSAFREAVIQKIEENAIGALPAPVLDALDFFSHEWQDMDDRVKSSIIGTLKSWLATIMQHPDLSVWAKAKEGDDTINPLDCMRGARIALHIPGFRYGAAGALVTSLIKARVFAELKNRADRELEELETPVVMIADEAQEITTDDDATMLAIGRSLQFSFIAASQTVEGIHEKLGSATASKWLSIFGNVITLPNRSGMSDQFVAERVGLTWKSLVSGTMGMAIRDAIRADVMTSDRSAAALQSSLTYTDGDLFSQFKRGTRGVMTTLAAALGQGTAQSPFSTQIGVLPTVFAGEMTTLLAEPNTALAVLTRARVPRRDVIRVQPVYHVPKIEPVKDYIEIGTSLAPADDTERHLVGLITLPPQLQNWLLTGE